MNLADFVIILMVLTFLPFNEGIIAKSPRWKRLADIIEFGVIKAFNWRADANVTNELDVLERYFKRASIVTGIFFASVVFLKSSPLFIWSSVTFSFCYFAWFSFKWTFKHAEAVQPFAPIVGYSLIAPWALLALDYLSPQAGLMQKFVQPMAFLPFHADKPFIIALVIFFGFVVFFGVYYFLGWFIFSPFAYAILAGLKASRAISAVLIRRFSRDFLNDISVLVQVFGLVYLYWVGRG